MTRNTWHIQREGETVTLSRRLPARFDVVVETSLPQANPVRLAHQIRQDLWRRLQRVRGFSPVVEITRTGETLSVRAGGQVAGRVPGTAVGMITDVLEDQSNRTRWLRHAGQPGKQQS